MSMRLALLAAVLCLSQAGCLFRKAPKTAPAPPAPTPKLELPPPSPPTAKPLEEPQLPTPPAPVPEEEPRVIRPQLEPLPKPPKTPPRRRAPAVKPLPAETQPPAADPAVVKPPDPAPEPVVLGEVIPDDVRRGLLTSINENLTSARRVLTGLRGRALTREQQESVGRIRSFIKQSEDMRSSDVRASAQFSTRAALLAKDLRESLR